MAGLGLVAALDDYQQGVDWKQQQGIKKQQQQDLADEAASRTAGTAVVQQAQQDNIAQQQKAWTDAGNDPAQFQPKPFQPDTGTILKAMDARNDALMKTGNVPLFVKSYAATVPVRNQIRQQVISSALAKYNQDRDGAALAQVVYPTIDDGTDIKSIQEDLTGGKGMQGASAAAADGQDVPKAYKIALSNGQTHTLTGDQIATMAHDAMMDPNKVADYEFQARLQELKDKGAIKVNTAKEITTGEQARKTEDVKGAYHLQGIGLEGQNRLQVAAGNNAATVGAAGLQAGATRYSADTHANATVKAADIGAAARRDANGAGKRMTATELQNEVGKQFGDVIADGALGGTRSAGPKTAAMAARADEIRRKDPNVTDMQAIIKAGGEFGFKYPGRPGLDPGPAKPAGATGDADYSGLWGGQ